MRFTDLPTPCFIIDENRLVQNLAVLRDVARRSGAKILLAQKAFSMFSTYPLLREYLAGTTASGLFEARLGHEEFGGETHVYSPAYTPDEFHEILNYADHIVFNSFTQWKKYGNLARVAGKSCGLRLNPECSTQPSDHAIYDPCGPTSRLGITEANFQPDLLDGIEGFHFHTLCEQNADDLVRTVAAFEMRFGRYMEGMKWLNLGGGHHITRADYDVDALVNCIIYLRDKYKVQIYLEPGEAVVLNAGYLVSTVLETMKNRKDIAILDTSAACHMPDVLENAVSSAGHACGRAGVQGVRLSADRPHLSCGRRHRRVFVRCAADGRRAGGFRGYGAVHHGQDQYVQRYASAADRRPPCGGHGRSRPHVQL